MPTSTTIYAFQKPIVGSDADVWGGSAGLNGNIDEMDALFATIATTGSANAYVLSTGLSLAAYVTGQTFRIRPNFTNTGAATINVDGLGARNLTKRGATALAAGDLTSGRVYTITNDGTQFQVMEHVALDVAQPLDATLTALAALSTSADQYIRATGADTFAMSSVTANAQLLLADTDVPRLGVANTFSAAGPQVFNHTSTSLQIQMNLAGTLRGYLGADATYSLMTYNAVATNIMRQTHATGLTEFLFNVDLVGASASIRARTRPLTTTTGTLVAADANCAGTLTGGITLPNSVFAAGDMVFVNAGAANRTITRGAGIAMHLNGTDVASATLNANTGGGIFWETASKAILTGAFV